MTITYEIVNTDVVSPWPYRRPLFVGEVKYTETPEPPAVNKMDATLLDPPPKLRKARRVNIVIPAAVIAVVVAIAGAAMLYADGFRLQLP